MRTVIVRDPLKIPQLTTNGLKWAIIIILTGILAAWTAFVYLRVRLVIHNQTELNLLRDAHDQLVIKHKSDIDALNIRLVNVEQSYGEALAEVKKVKKQ